MKESKSERFRRLANARVNKLIAMIRLIGNLSNPMIYEYRPDQVAQIFTALQTELERARTRFYQSGKHKKRFTLSEPIEKTAPEEHEPNFEILLPDGTLLRAVGFEQDEYPGINIYAIAQGEAPALVCFAEFNPNKPGGHQLCVTAYQSNLDEPVYYEPYTAERNEHEQPSPAPNAEA